jgi:hypothetical protein
LLHLGHVVPVVLTFLFDPCLVAPQHHTLNEAARDQTAPHAVPHVVAFALFRQLARVRGRLPHKHGVLPALCLLRDAPRTLLQKLQGALLNWPAVFQHACALMPSSLVARSWRELLQVDNVCLDEFGASRSLARRRRDRDRRVHNQLAVLEGLHVVEDAFVVEARLGCDLALQDALFARPGDHFEHAHRLRRVGGDPAHVLAARVCVGREAQPLQLLHLVEALRQAADRLTARMGPQRLALGPRLEARLHLQLRLAVGRIPHKV